MHRLFVGLRPPAPMREHLLAVTGGIAGARWQDDEQLHLTLQFIGEVDRPMAEDIVTALDRITHPAPDLAVRGVGSFQRKDRPHTLWAAVVASDRLCQLQNRIERALVLAGVPAEPRTFFPHITLARLNRAAGPVSPFLERNAGLVLPPVELDAFFLFESHLGRSGAAYNAVGRFALT